VSGTPAYMSPEQARGEKVDKRTDIYALGIMLYEMLAGIVPFQADTTFGMLMKHINEPPPPIKGISPELQALINRALSKKPEYRYESAGELANEFMALFNGQTISPGTLHIAEIMRKEAGEAQQTKTQPEGRRFNWVRIGAEILIAGILLFVIYQIVDTNRQVAMAPNVPIGRVRFEDSGFYVDALSLTLNSNVPQPEEGMHYEGWLIADDGEAARGIGPVIYGPSGIGRLDYSDPNLENLLRNYDQVQITLERDDVAVSAPTGEVVYSSIFPPESLAMIRHLLVTHETPDEGPLMQNLWWYSAEYVNDSINGDSERNGNMGIVQAFEEANEAALRKRTEEVINQIVGDLSDRYLDYDNDGETDVAGDGYGSLPQGEERLGYIRESALYAQRTADAADSTANIRTYNENVQICLQNVEIWTNEILDLALELNDMPFGPEMEPIVSQLSTLGVHLIDGVDTNENERVDPIAGECGATLAYYSAYYMADFQIYLGPNRVPPSGK
jgi:hypothetical protein